MSEKKRPDVTPHAHPKLVITISKTSDGKNDYLQVMSGDQFSINVVLIANEIQVNDTRVPA